MSVIKDIHDLVASLQTKITDRELIPMFTQLQSLISVAQSKHFAVANENLDLKKAHLDEVTERNESHSDKMAALNKSHADAKRIIEDENTKFKGEIQTLKAKHSKEVANLNEQIDKYNARLARLGVKDNGASFGVVIS